MEIYRRILGETDSNSRLKTGYFRISETNTSNCFEINALVVLCRQNSGNSFELRHQLLRGVDIYFFLNPESIDIAVWSWDLEITPKTHA